MPSPEPMGMVLNSLYKIELGVCIKMIHRISPKMLYPVLKKNGFDFIEKKLGEEEFEIFVFSKKDKELKEILQND